MTEAETAADAIDNHPGLEGATYSILEEDEDKGVWRIDAFPTTDEEDEGLMALLGEYDLKVTRDTLACQCRRVHRIRGDVSHTVSPRSHEAAAGRPSGALDPPHRLRRLPKPGRSGTKCRCRRAATGAW